MSTYLSFHANDLAFARRIYDELAAKGVGRELFWLGPGLADNSMRVDESITLADVHLAVITAAYLNSFAARSELQRLLARHSEGKSRLIALRPDTTPLPEELTAIQAIDFSTFERGIEELLKALASITPPDTSAAAVKQQAAPNAPPPPAQEPAGARQSDAAAGAAETLPDPAGPRVETKVAPKPTKRPVRKANPAAAKAQQTQQVQTSVGLAGTVTEEPESTDAPRWAQRYALSAEVNAVVEQAFALAALDGAEQVTREHLAWAFVERGRGFKESRTPRFVWETLANMGEGVKKAAAAVVRERFPALWQPPGSVVVTPATDLDHPSYLVLDAAALIRDVVAHDDPTVAARHLLAGLMVLSTGPGDKGAFAGVVERFALDPVKFREKFLGFVRSLRQEDDQEAWKALLARWRSMAGLRSFADERAKARQTPAAVPPAEPRKRAPRQRKAPDAPPPLTVAPASTSDQPSAEDHLGFKPYVAAVAEFLRNPGTLPPLTLSIEGEWGSGKSSFMRQLRAELDADPKAITVWFNPWRHDREEAVWAAFALEFLRGVSARLPRLERWRGHYRLLRTRFSWRDGWLDVVRAGAVALTAIIAVTILFYVSVSETGVLSRFAKALAGEHADNAFFDTLLGVGGVGASLAIAVSLGKQAKAFIGNPLRYDLKRYIRSPDYQSRISFIEHFHEDFGRIVKSYVGTRRVYVFIDDLDRCEVPKAADLMQALNLMMGVEEQPIFFVLGMDREKIAASLAVKFKELLPFITADPSRAGAALDGDAALRGLEYGSEFVEKFVQVSFLVPQPRLDDVARLLGKLSERASPGATPPKPALEPVAAAAASRPAQAAQTPDVTIPLQEGGTARILQKAVSDPGNAALAAPSIVPPPPPEPTPAELAAQRRLTAEVAVDSARLRTIAVMVAPALDQNPRRVKQFVNVFRLRAYIAIRTGLIKPDAERAPGDLTFEKLGKFVAIGLRWPLLLANLEDDPELLTRLQKRALQQPVAGRKPVTGSEAHWASRARLRELLRAGLVDAEGKPVRGAAAVWSLAELDADLLLQVAAPPPHRPAPEAEPVPA
ncbi:MAG TPA: P-loop NTPase fold protein [Longimicrobium sp.]|nr:P-loop NTPase fold protein [Longimicrobium sp.]